MGNAQNGQSRWRRFTRGFLKFCALTLAYTIIALAIVLAAFNGIERRRATRGMTADQKADMRRFMKEPVDIPKDWQVIEPYPEEVLNAGNVLKERWGILTEFEYTEEVRDPYAKLSHGEPMATEDWEAVRRVVLGQKGLKESVADLVDLPGYDQDAFPSAFPILGISNLLLGQMICRRLCLETYLHARDEEWAEAFQTVMVALRMARRHPASPVITYLHGLSIVRIVSRCVADTATACDDPAALTDLLAEMNRLEREIDPIIHPDARFTDIIGTLRTRGRKGRDVDLTPGHPLNWYFRQWRETALPVSTVEEPFLEKLVKALGVSGTIDVTTYRMAKFPSSEVLQTYRLATEAGYDLARLTAASRIHELETGERPEDLSAVVDKYFPEGLPDPFAEDGYLTKDGADTIYSIGPDGADDAAAIRYDSTNGTLSRGDIFFRSPPAGPGTDNIGQQVGK